jgi:endoglucanase
MWLAAAAPDHLAYLGVNLSGPEFGVPDQMSHVYDPGKLGRDYTFPTKAEVDEYAKDGFNLVRIPFAWERLQPKANGPFDPAYLAGLDAVVRDGAAADMAVILEPTNFGYGYGAQIGTPATPDSIFADLWRRLAAQYRGRRNVIFGLMGEPHDQTPGNWLHSAQAAIDAIRGAGAGNEILVPGTYYSQGGTWLSRGNAALFADHITDPANNFAFEVHQYTDADSSGRSPVPASLTIGADRLVAITGWAERTGKRLFLAEFGAGPDPASVMAMTNEIAFVTAHRDVWQGAALWGAGPWWPADYPLLVERPGPRPQIEALKPFMPR